MQIVNETFCPYLNLTNFYALLSAIDLLLPARLIHLASNLRHDIQQILRKFQTFDSSAP